LADGQRFYYCRDWSKSSNSCFLLLLHKCPIRTIYILDTMFLLAVFWSTSTTIVLESFKAARSGHAHRIWYLYDKLIFVGTEQVHFSSEVWGDCEVPMTHMDTFLCGWVWIVRHDNVKIYNSMFIDNICTKKRFNSSQSLIVLLEDRLCTQII
jgi:hypothetical protein